MNSRIYAIVEPEQLVQIDADSAALGISRADWLRRAIERALFPVNRPGFGAPARTAEVAGVMVNQLFCPHEHVSDFASGGRICDDCQMSLG
jgi:hypothetical protein